MKNILILAPHPDDETLGCGGVIAIKSRLGYEINIAVLTDGSRLFEEKFGLNTTPAPQEVSDLRKKETERTVKLLGGDPAKIRYLDYTDGSLQDKTDEGAEKIRDLLNDLNPEQVYIPNQYEAHQDHLATHVIGQKAFELVDNNPELYEYFLSLKPGLTIDDIEEEITEVDISEFYELKKVALSMFHCHLNVVLKEQTEPLFENFNHYLDRTEKFIVHTVRNRS